MGDNRVFRFLGLLVTVLAIAIAWGVNQTDSWPLEWLRVQKFIDIGSEYPGPEIYMFSEDPVVVYVKNFVNAQEAAHLVQLA
jgi:prolyl 4-hydroxylase